MLDLGALKVRITADSSEATEELKKFSDETDGSGEKAKGFGTKAKVAMAVAGAAAVKFGKDSVETAGNFEQSMANLSATMGITKDDGTGMYQELEKAARENAKTSVYSATESADALQYMALAGFSVKDSIAALPNVLKLSTAAGTDLAATSDMVTDNLAAFGLTAKDTAHFSDVLIKAQNQSNTTVELLGESFKNCNAIMASHKQSVESTGAVLGALADNGLKGSEAGTALTAMWRDMDNAMKDGKITIGDTSIAIADSNGNYRDMVDIIADIDSATQGMTDTEKSAALAQVFTADSTKAVNLALLSGTDTLNTYKDSLLNCDGAAQKASETMQNTYQGALANFSSAVEELQISLGSKLLPVITLIINVFSSFVNWLSSGSASSTAFIVAVGALTAGLIAYQVATSAAAIASTVAAAATGAFGAALAIVTSPIFLIVAAITALIAIIVLLVKHWDAVKEKTIGALDTMLGGIKDFVAFWQGVFFAAIEKLKEVFTKVFDGIKAVVDKVFSFIKSGIDKVASAFEKIVSVIKKVADKFGEFKQNVIDKVTGVVSGVKEKINSIKSFLANFSLASAGRAMFQSLWNGIKGVWNSIKSWVSEKVNWLKSKLTFGVSSKGNKVTVKGHRNGLREVPYDGYAAQLHKGEMVLTQPEADKYRRNGETLGARVTNTVNFNGNYSFRDEADIDYFMKEAGKLIKRKVS